MRKSGARGGPWVDSGAEKMDGNPWAWLSPKEKSSHSRLPWPGAAADKPPFPGQEISRPVGSEAAPHTLQP